MMNDFKKDYYRILEIKTSATTDEIKLAYRKQAKKYHPDLHPDNYEYEDLIRDINEAYEVLGNKDERFAYDQYLINKKTKEKQEDFNNPINKNKRTYTKTTTAHTEERAYVKGEIFIKYFGEHDEKATENVLRETFYKINVTKTEAIIEEVNRGYLTKEFEVVFASNKPIKLNINQPICCRFINENGSAFDYKLEIFDLTIPNPEIVDVTKHEGESFGTITGTFYGYVKETKSYDEHETVEECFGETGKTEQKNENGKNYFRKEYYNADCTKYWGNWTLKNAGKSANSSGGYSRTNSDGKYRNNFGNNNNGCFGSLGGVLGSLLIFLFIPQLLFLLPFFVIPFLFNLFPIKLWTWFAKAATLMFGLIFLLAAIATVDSRNKDNKQAVLSPKPQNNKPTYKPILDSQSNHQVIDTLISHHISWNDYNGKPYEGTFSVKKSVADQSHFYKENLEIPFDEAHKYDEIIYLLKENDKHQLDGFYVMLDSLRLKNRPNQMEFAEIIVSLVQSIPYTLILPEACNAQLYQDEYTRKYLAKPNARCDGYQKFGVNTPVEFLAYLNGDCDTRTLLLYTVLSHYKYDVALLSSEHYSHSVLGINLPYEGLSFNYDSERYVFWETTAPNIRPGILSNEISNKQYWRISLKSK